MKIGTEIAHVTRDSDTTFKVKGQGYQTALPVQLLAQSHDTRLEGSLMHDASRRVLKGAGITFHGLADSKLT